MRINVQLVLLEHIQEKEVEVVLNVEVENIHLLEHQVVLIVQLSVGIINVLFQQENVMDVKQDIDIAMEIVLHVDH